MQLNLRTTLPALPLLRELVQDLIQRFGPVAETRLIEVTSPYKVGMTVSLPTSQEPKALQLVRCYDPKQPSAVSAFTGAVDFTWTGSAAEIIALRGLTPGTTPLAMTFTVLYG